jgi:hypothetical protein
MARFMDFREHGPDDDATRQHHAALGVPSGDAHQVDSLTWPGLTEQSRPGSQA